ncbi:DUF2164 domain-containing protein [Microbacteriaceae bacterium 4G12]
MHRIGQGLFLPHARVKTKGESESKSFLFCTVATYMSKNQIGCIYTKGESSLIPITLSRNEKEIIVNDLQEYFREEGLEELGNLQAEQLLLFVMNQVSPYIYNRAIADARKLINERIQAIEEDLYTLEAPVKK